MVKLLNISFAFISLASLGMRTDRVVIKPTKQFLVETDGCIGPYQKYQTTDNEIQLKIRKRLSTSVVNEVSTRLRVYNNATNNIVRSQMVTSQISTTPVTINLTLPIKTYLGDSGLRVVLDFIPTNEEPNEMGQYYEFNIYPIDASTTIYPYNHQNSTIENRGSCYKFTLAGLEDYGEKITFGSVYDYLDVDYYYRFNLEQFWFTYINPSSSFKYTTANLIISNYDGVSLGQLPRDGRGRICIPLQVNNSGNKCYLAFKNNLYVNRTTLEMTTSPSSYNYTQTSYFYMPINQRTQANKMNFGIELNGVGISGHTLSWSVKHYAYEYYFGNCNNSEYCVKGGVRG